MLHGGNLFKEAGCAGLAWMFMNPAVALGASDHPCGFIEEVAAGASMFVVNFSGLAGLASFALGAGGKEWQAGGGVELHRHGTNGGDAFDWATVHDIIASSPGVLSGVGSGAGG